MFLKLITLKFYEVVLVHVNQFIHAKHTCTTQNKRNAWQKITYGPIK
jgi:hypothetical protein